MVLSHQRRLMVGTSTVNIFYRGVLLLSINWMDFMNTKLYGT